jgi:hypothetical protein
LTNKRNSILQGKLRQGELGTDCPGTPGRPHKHSRHQQGTGTEYKVNTALLFLPKAANPLRQKVYRLCQKVCHLLAKRFAAFVKSIAIFAKSFAILPKGLPPLPKGLSFFLLYGDAH